MSNIHRLRLTDQIFFVTCSLRRDRRAFDDGEFQTILEAIERSRRDLGYLFCGYVLMPDHWHALIWPRFPLTISLVIERIKSSCSGRLNKLRGARGPNWQHQFWDRFVRRANEFSERLDYMHYNPVRKGLVARPEEWHWSSYNNFSLSPGVVAACPIQIDYIRLPDSYHA
jgi:putative transposase